LYLNNAKKPQSFRFMAFPQTIKTLFIETNTFSSVMAILASYYERRTFLNHVLIILNYSHKKIRQDVIKAKKQSLSTNFPFLRHYFKCKRYKFL